jgi:NADH-quinone oxidoreductase subunit J
MYAAIFYLIGAVIVAATVLAVTRRQPVHAVLYLVIGFLGTSCLFYLLGAPLLAAFTVIIYAGAILVLFLFVIMLLQRSPRELAGIPQWGPGVLLGTLFVAVTAGAALQDPGGGVPLQGAVAPPRELGLFLFERYWLAVEMVSILLLVALVAVIQVGRRRGAASSQGEEG